MKLIKNNICYVEIDDLLRIPIPGYILNSIKIINNEFIECKGVCAIEYFNKRKDIVDYYSICGLSIEELDKMIGTIREEFNKLSAKWLECSERGIKALDKDNKYQNALKELKAIYSSLCNYKANKRGELSQEIRQWKKGDFIKMLEFKLNRR